MECQRKGSIGNLRIVCGRMNGLRILFSSTSDLSRPGAERTHVVSIVNGFARLSHSVHLLVRSLGDLALHKNVKVTEFDWNDKLLRIPLWRLTVVASRLIMRISRILREDRINLVYERHNDFDLGVSIAGRFGIPSILELNGIWELEARMNGMSEDSIRKFVRWENSRISEATAAVAVSPTIFSHYDALRIRLGGLHFVPNGVDTTHFSPIAPDGARTQLGIRASHVISFVGDFRKHHGLEFLIESMPEIVRRFPGVLLLVVGDNMKSSPKLGPTRDSLRKLAYSLEVEGHCWFPGRVEDPRRYIGASDLCVAPWTVDECERGLKLFEYMACGRPVVSTSISDLPYFIEERGIGKVVPPQNSQALADAICSMLDDPEGLETMGIRARELATNEHSWSKAVRQISDIGTELLKQDPSPT